ncbi:hypothetical protein KUT98_23020 [Pseudomonas aeruginosa]|nr:hypothetical protein [Pseudomonas aeruginosa]
MSISKEQSVLNMIPGLEKLTPEEVEQLKLATENAQVDRGGRFVIFVDLLPSRIVSIIRDWGRVAPEVVLDEVADAIEALD